jgi:hypothetical protein
MALPAHAQTPEGKPVPYSARSRESRNAVERTASVRCIGQATNALGDYAGPQAARENAAGAFFMSCVLKQMPQDWPLAADLQDQAARMAVAARAADPNIDICLLTACKAEKDIDAQR